MLAARRDQLLAAAVAAIEAEGAQVTMTRMAAEAGVTKPVLYRYFGDRRGVYEAVAAVFAAGLLAELRGALAQGGSPRRLLASALDTYLAYVERQPEVYRFLTRRLPAETASGHETVIGFVHRIAADVAGVLSERLRAAKVDAVHADLLAFGITGMVQLAGERWQERATMRRDEVVHHLTDLLWNGLARVEGSGPTAADGPPRDGSVMGRSGPTGPRS
jgi:AcrR family transcriptional regulator